MTAPSVDNLWSEAGPSWGWAGDGHGMAGGRTARARTARPQGDATTGGRSCAHGGGSWVRMGTQVSATWTGADPPGRAGDVAGTTIAHLTCPDGAVSTIHNPHHLPRTPHNITQGRRSDRPGPPGSAWARHEQPH